MAPRRRLSEAPPPYSHRPSSNEQTVAIAPDFPLAVDAIRLIQERFPGTSAGDAWEFVLQLAALVRVDVRRRQEERGQSSPRATSERAGQGDPSSVIPED